MISSSEASEEEASKEETSEEKASKEKASEEDKDELAQILYIKFFLALSVLRQLGFKRQIFLKKNYLKCKLRQFKLK